MLRKSAQRLVVAEIGGVQGSFLALSADFEVLRRKTWKTSPTGRIFDFLVYNVSEEKVYFDAF